MTIWQTFAALGVILCVAEIFVPGFIVLPIGVAFIIAAPLAMLTDELVVQLGILVVCQIAVYYSLRRVRQNPAKPKVASNAEGMIGVECEVTEPIAPDQTGYVKLYGDHWQARTKEMTSLAIGDRAVIVATDGNKVVVKAKSQKGYVP